MQSLPCSHSFPIEYLQIECFYRTLQAVELINLDDLGITIIPRRLEFGLTKSKS